jgi:hypothetical protein
MLLGVFGRERSILYDIKTLSMLLLELMLTKQDTMEVAAPLTLP